MTCSRQPSRPAEPTLDARQRAEPPPFERRNPSRSGAFGEMHATPGGAVTPVRMRLRVADECARARRSASLRSAAACESGPASSQCGSELQPHGARIRMAVTERPAEQARRSVECLFGRQPVAS